MLHRIVSGWTLVKLGLSWLTVHSNVHGSRKDVFFTAKFVSKEQSFLLLAVEVRLLFNGFLNDYEWPLFHHMLWYFGSWVMFGPRKLGSWCPEFLLNVLNDVVQTVPFHSWQVIAVETASVWRSSRKGNLWQHRSFLRSNKMLMILTVLSSPDYEVEFCSDWTLSRTAWEETRVWIMGRSSFFELPTAIRGNLFYTSCIWQSSVPLASHGNFEVRELAIKLLLHSRARTNYTVQSRAPDNVRTPSLIIYNILRYDRKEVTKTTAKEYQGQASFPLSGESLSTTKTFSTTIAAESLI